MWSKRGEETGKYASRRGKEVKSAVEVIDELEMLAKGKEEKEGDGGKKVERKEIPLDA